MEDNSTDIRGGSGVQMAEGTTQPATGGYGPPGTTEQPTILPNEPSSKLIVHNVPLDCNFRQLKEVCQEFGPYVKIKSDYSDQKTNETSQFGIMNFPDEVSSQQAMERLNGMNLRGNKLSVRYGNANRDDDRNRGRGGFDRGRGRGGFGRGRGDRGRGRGFGRGVGGSRGAPTGLSSQLSPRHIRIHGLDGYYDWRVLKDTLAEKCKTEIKFCQQTEEGVVVEFHDMRDAEQASHDFNNGMPLFNQRVSAIQGDVDSERSRETRSRRSRSPARRSRSPDRRSGNGRSRDRSPRDRSRSRSRSRRGTASKSKSRSPHRAPSRENFAQPRQSYMEQLPPPNAPQGPENETFYERLVIETADGREREIFRQVSASQLGVAPAAPPVQASRPVAQDHGDNRWGGAARSPSHREHSDSRGYRNGYERRGSSREHRDERRERDYRR